LLRRGYARIEIPNLRALRQWVDERSELAPVH